MLFFRSEIGYKYCPLSENSISEVFQRFKSEIEDFVFLFHEKSDISPFCLTTLTVYSFFLVAEHVWKTPEMEFSDRVDMVLKKSRKKYSFFEKLQRSTFSLFFWTKIWHGTSSPREAIQIFIDFWNLRSRMFYRL